MQANKFLVWGNPISHSLSPLVHADFASQRGESIDYKRRGEGLDEDQFIEAFNAFFQQEGGKGSNITAPFKNTVYNIIEQRSEVCEIAQACNTVVVLEDGSLLAENTDGYGLKKDLLDLQWLDINSKILILGAGGAVTGVLYPLLQAGGSVDIFNRTLSRAQEVVERFSKFGEIEAVTDYDLNDYDLVINAVAYKHQTKETVNLRTTRITNPNTRFYDMQYSERGTTTFLEHISSLGVEEERLSDGLGMLVKQAALSHYYWFGVMPDAESTLNKLRLCLAKQKANLDKVSKAKEAAKQKACAQAAKGKLQDCICNHDPELKIHNQHNNSAHSQTNSSQTNSQTNSQENSDQEVCQGSGQGGQDNQGSQANQGEQSLATIQDGEEKASSPETKGGNNHV